MRLFGIFVPVGEMKEDRIRHQELPFIPVA